MDFDFFFLGADGPPPITSGLALKEVLAMAVCAAPANSLPIIYIEMKLILREITCHFLLIFKIATKYFFD